MKISVIIPCYNEEQYIGQAIGSIIEQTRPADEIIVVDDGSDDRSPEIAKSFGEMVTILSSGGGGAPKARNRGAEYAFGDALMFFDADDVMGPHVLEALAGHLEKYPDGIAACPWFRLGKVDGKWVKQHRSCPPLKKEKDYLSGWIREIYHPPCSVLWSREAFEKTGGWDPQVSVNQDGDLMMRALVQGIELGITTNGAAYYRRMPPEERSESQSAGQFKRAGRESQIFVLRKIIKKLVEREKLDSYRHSIEETLNKIRKLCLDQYPELAEECTKMINQYGDPNYKENEWNYFIIFDRIVLRSLNSMARMLSQLGLSHIRRILAREKKAFLQKGSDRHIKLARNQNPDIGEEVKYGLDAYRKVSV